MSHRGRYYVLTKRRVHVKAHFPMKAAVFSSLCYHMLYFLIIMVMQVLLLWPLLWQCHSFYNSAKKGFMDIWVHPLRLGSPLDYIAVWIHIKLQSDTCGRGTGKCSGLLTSAELGGYLSVLYTTLWTKLPFLSSLVYMKVYNGVIPL